MLSSPDFELSAFIFILCSNSFFKKKKKKLFVLDNSKREAEQAVESKKGGKKAKTTKKSEPKEAKPKGTPQKKSPQKLFFFVLNFVFSFFLSLCSWEEGQARQEGHPCHSQAALSCRQEVYDLKSVRFFCLV